MLDVTDTGAAEPMVAAIEDEIGSVDVLVNNAGYGVEGTFEEPRSTPSATSSTSTSSVSSRSPKPSCPACASAVPVTFCS